MKREKKVAVAIFYFLSSSAIISHDGNEPLGKALFGAFQGKIIMNAIITVVGSDKVGIIARVSAFLAERNINILDISQTVLSGNFVMMMVVDLSSSTKALEELKKELVELGESFGVSISMMHEKVFSAMHRV